MISRAGEPTRSTVITLPTLPAPFGSIGSGFNRHPHGDTELVLGLERTLGGSSLLESFPDEVLHRRGWQHVDDGKLGAERSGEPPRYPPGTFRAL